MLLTSAYAQYNVSRLQATLQARLPLKTTASCCLSAHTVYSDQDSGLSKLSCLSTVQTAVWRARLRTPSHALETEVSWGATMDVLSVKT